MDWSEVIWCVYVCVHAHNPAGSEGTSPRLALVGSFLQRFMSATCSTHVRGWRLACAFSWYMLFWLA